MTTERWQLIKAIYLEAQELSPIERAAYLLHACEGDADLQAEVRSLLARGYAAGEAIEQVVGAATCLAVESEDADCGVRLGRYELIRENRTRRHRSCLSCEAVRLGVCTKRRC